MNELFNIHRERGICATYFAPKLTMGALKPFLTGFVQKGVLALKTPEMKLCVQKSFDDDGFFTIMRSDDMQLAMQLEVSLAVENPLVIVADDEDDENIEEFNFADDSEDELDHTLYKMI